MVNGPSNWFRERSRLPYGEGPNPTMALCHLVNMGGREGKGGG